jgi:glycosyl-4,4'-diaponeurosporenoate acyltransferase
MPEHWFQPPRGLTGEALIHERVFQVRSWKDRLPDAAKWFAGGFAKGRLARRDAAYLQRFIRETWRGELCHWCALGCAPIFFLWNPWWADAVIAAYALAANLPCIIVQRYNRIRMRHLLAFREGRE